MNFFAILILLNDALVRVDDHRLLRLRVLRLRSEDGLSNFAD
jgi:hypothetical protein